jgi:hypothetical protein
MILIKKIESKIDSWIKDWFNNQLKRHTGAYENEWERKNLNTPQSMDAYTKQKTICQSQQDTQK